MDQDRNILAAISRMTSLDTFSRYGVHGIGVARKVAGGKQTDETALAFFVSCKLPEHDLPPERRIPGTLRFVTRGEGEIAVTTDVVESPPPGLLGLPPGAAHRPVPGGVRCYVPASSDSGTLGGWVWDKTDETIVFLSNQHVLGATPGLAVNQPNSDVFAPPGETYQIGHVKRAAGLTAARRPHTPDQCNFVDAAVGGVGDSDDIHLTVLDIGPAVYEIGNVALGDPVEKFGQITEHTEGSVTAVAVNTIYDFPGIGDVIMCDLFRVEPDDASTAFSASGDSGSLIFRRNPEEDLNPCVGLLFGGGGSATSGNQWAHGCRIQNVFSALDLDVLCSGGLPAFLDALLSDGEDEMAEVAAFETFTPGRRRPGFLALARGMAREVETRIRRGTHGRALSDLVRKHRGALVQMLVTNGEVRRTAIRALRPILKRALTADRLMSRTLDKKDLKRLGVMADAVTRHAPDALARDLAPFVKRLETAVDCRIEELI